MPNRCGGYYWIYRLSISTEEVQFVLFREGVKILAAIGSTFKEILQNFDWTVDLSMSVVIVHDQIGNY